ncbi:MAG: immunoglobulin domain-containing protein, partial [Solirubrobacteraceae bacterium]
MRTALGRAIVVSIVVLAVAPASSALAGSGVSILSPSSGSSSTDAAPVFSGTTNATINILTLLIYPGSSATGTPLQTLTFEPLFPEETWTLTPAALGEGTYTAVALQAGELGEPGESAPVTFTVEAAPVVQTNPVSATVTAGETATFTATASGTPAPSVQWEVSTDHGATWAPDTADAGNTTDTLSVASVSLAQSGHEYRALFTNSAGSQESEPATLTVQTPPVITLNPVSATLIAGETATFTAAASGSPTPSVQWQVSSDHGSSWAADTSDAGNTTDTLTVASVTLAQSGDEYRAMFTNAVDSQASEPATLTVQTPPAITQNPQSTTVTAGETATFKAAASGTPKPSVQWQISSNGGSSWSADTSDAGNKTDMLSVASVTLAESGDEYRALFTNAAGSKESEAATLTVQTRPAVTLNPQNATVTAGETATFTAAASGSPTPTVQWQVSSNGGSSWAADSSDAGDKTDTLTVASVSSAQNGYEYRALFTNAAVSLESAAATLTVQVAPTVTTNPQSVTVHAGETATFKAAASGTPTPTVQWEVSSNHGSSWAPDTADAGNKTDTLKVASVTLAQSGYEYRAVFSNVVGSRTSSAATLTV